MDAITVACRRASGPLPVEAYAARAARVRLAESSRPGDAAALRETLERREKEARNYRDIVDRQKTIERIYRAPKPAYVAQAAVVRDLRTRVDMLGAD